MLKFDMEVPFSNFESVFLSNFEAIVLFPTPKILTNIFIKEQRNEKLMATENFNG